MSLQSLTEAVTNPNVAVPAASFGALANMMVMVPHLINMGTAIYITLLVCHKGWQMYKEWRDDPTAPGKRK
jgi:hypothetical protein